MINQDNPYFKPWLSFLATNPKKATKELESCIDNQARCCLGHYCAIALPPDARYAKGSVVSYLNETTLLPKEAAKDLNIMTDGSFTDEGTKVVLRFLRENNCSINSYIEAYEITSLAMVNDKTQADHELIGMLIEHMAHVEADYGIEMFKAYGSTPW